jgi:glycine/D-amino acid oxidase-like deaminating enzyme/nitrite reductase/ring-hydroxylating ferredoxin subunit
MTTPTTASGGRHPSIWIATTPETGHPPLAGATEADVVVVGGGITGLTAAALLTEAGARVVLLEARRLVTGTTGNTTAKVSALQGTVYRTLLDGVGEEAARVYAEANLRAVETIARRVEDGGIECDLRRCPAYTYAGSAEHLQAVEAEVEAAQRLGVAAVFDDRPGLPFPVAGAVRLDDQLLFHPRRYCLALADAVLAGGGHIFEGSRVTGIEPEGERRRVTTAGGSVLADRVLVATLLPFPRAGGHFAKAFASRSYAMSLAVEGEVPWGMYLSVDTPTRSLRPHPTPDGALLIVDGEGHTTGQEPDTAARYEAVEAWARDRFAVREVTHRWSAQDYSSGDSMPYVGRLVPGEDRILVATAYRKWGMTNGTAAAGILADLVLGRPNPWAETLDATRVNPGTSLPEILKENAAVAAHFIADRVASTLSRRHADDLAPGEAAIVHGADGKVAAYRDESGTVHACSAACTHLGCEVAWNTAERTWDCPCHGSRFAYTGEVIEGPATADLEPRPAG